MMCIYWYNILVIPYIIKKELCGVLIDYNNSVRIKMKAY